MKDFKTSNQLFPEWPEACDILYEKCNIQNNWGFQVECNDENRIKKIKIISKFNYDKIPDIYVDKIKAIIDGMLYMINFNLNIDFVQFIGMDYNINCIKQIQDTTTEYEDSRIEIGKESFNDELCLRFGLIAQKEAVDEAISKLKEANII